jgi:hypothetical protein
MLKASRHEDLLGSGGKAPCRAAQREGKVGQFAAGPRYAEAPQQTEFLYLIFIIYQISAFL